MDRKIIALAVVVAAAVAAVAYVQTSRGQNRLIISTTTSLYDTGLLDEMSDRYSKAFGTKLDFVAAGSGAALEAARRGDADVVLVHSPSTEIQFLAEGVVGARRIIAYNFFSIVGPANDPAGIKGLSTIETLKKISQSGATWISRGDNSGTNVKEKSLWRAAGIAPSDKVWYLESGSGMGSTLRLADERGAYTLTDMGTYLKYRQDGLIDLSVLVERGNELLNVYSVMAVNPDKNPNVNFSGAVKFIEFLVSESGQNMIGEFGRAQYGGPLFYPAVQVLRQDTDAQIADWIRSYAFIENSECPSRYRLGQETLYP